MADLEQKLSAHFKLGEMLVSQTAVRQEITEQFEPSQQVIDNLTALCVNVLQPLREMIKKPVNVTSGYRCKRVNTAIGGAKKSQHLVGQAADINIKGKTTEALFQYIKNSGIPFDQLIQEFDSWVHVSYNSQGNRGEVLRATKKNGKTVYTRE